VPARKTVTEAPADPVTERGKQLDDAHAAYLAAYDAVWRDCHDEIKQAEQRCKRRRDGLTAEYEAAVERIRAGE
jgi:hypothetical protein